MPIPAILAGLAAAGAALLGVGAQMDAKDTNERAQKIADEAKSLYNDSKRSLETAQMKTETSLLSLGNSKKQVLDTSINQFLTVYERIKNIELSESVGLDEIKNFTLEKKDALQLREMSDIYKSTFSSGTAGAATGTIIALAASGSLPIVTGTLSVAGSALVAGEISVAAGLAGSALSFGAAMTPLAAIAAPALLFSGISASMKADENFEKAQAMYAEANAASEQMKISEVLCVAIADRADMFNSLLQDLNGLFSHCTALLDGVTRKKMGLFKNKTVDARTFTEEELKLVAVTRSLAGAVKSVIDTPILTADGAVSFESKNIYDNTSKKLPILIEAIDEVKRVNYNAKTVVMKTNNNQKNLTENKLTVREATRNLVAIILGVFISIVVAEKTNGSIALILLAFSITTLLVMNNNSESKLFVIVKKGCGLAIWGSFCYILYTTCSTIIAKNNYIVENIFIGVISMIFFEKSIPEEGKKSGSLRRTFARVSGCVAFFAIAILLYVLLHKFIGISHTISAIITVVLYALFAYVAVVAGD